MGKNAATGPQDYMTHRSGFAVEYIAGESQVLYSFALPGLRHRLRNFPRMTCAIFAPGYGPDDNFRTRV